MKKSRIISVALTLALVLTTVFAGTQSVFADTAKDKIKADAPAIGAKFQSGTTMKAAEEDIVVPAVNLNSKSSAKIYPTVAYSSANLIYTKVSIPKAGTFSFGIWAGAPGAVGLYNSIDAGAKPIKTMEVSQSDFSNDDYDTFNVKVSKGGTYYLVFGSSSSTPAQSAFDAYYAPAGGTPSKNVAYYGSSIGSNYSYYKAKATATGYLTISFPAGTDGDYSKYSVKLMNSSKSKNLFKGVVTVDKYGRNFITYAGVPKGTYYIGIKTTEDYYKVKWNFTKVSENSGSTRAKAKNIYKGNTKKGTILATQTSKNADWYKIKVNSSQLVKLAFTTYTGGYSGGFRISVYSAGKTKAFGSADFYYGDPADILSLTTKINGIDTGRLQKGTYYIKVQKYGSASGFYKLQWK